MENQSPTQEMSNKQKELKDNIKKQMNYMNILFPCYEMRLELWKQEFSVHTWILR